jgi:putative transcriptional regulator
MIRFKIDVLQELKKKGYNTTRLRNEKIIPEGIITKIRKAYKDNSDINISTMTLNTLCALLGKQPAQIIEYIKDETTGSIQD